MKEAVLSKLEKVKGSDQDGNYTALCPFHDDHEPSLSVNFDKGVYYCFGCNSSGPISRLAQRLGVPVDSGFDTKPGTKTIVATYDYTDETGKLLYQVVRYEPKDFRQRRPDGSGGWLWSLKGVKPVLYHLPEVIKAVRDGVMIYIPEGEKDVDNLRSLGLVATCNPMGAGKWQDSYSEALRGADLIIIPDNDKPGHDHAAQVAKSCCGIAKRVRTLELPGGNKSDVSDWFSVGGTREQLEKLANEAPEWTTKALSDSNKFKLALLADLMAEPEEIVSWLWDRSLPSGGLSLIAAKPKVGKSTLARNLALKVARGEPFLDRDTSEGPVIYLALEEKRSEVAAHFTKMGAKDESIFIHTGSAPEEALAALEMAIRERKAVLAIVDPLLRMVRLRDGNDYAEVTRALEPLLMLARESGCHILAVHHMGKSEREGGDSILGSTALFAAVDTALIMKRRDSMRTLESIQRYGQDIERLALEFEPETGLTQAAGTIAELELKQTAAAICEILGDSELTEADIREKTGGNTGLVGKALRWLCTEGHVKRNGSGKRGDPYVYILVSRFSYIGKREKQVNEKPPVTGEQAKLDKQEKLETSKPSDILEVA
jgi:putative DNA primase/helicase